MYVLIGPGWNWSSQESWLMSGVVQGCERILSPADQSCHYFSTF